MEILFLTTSVCFIQDRPSSIIKPRKLNDSTRPMAIPSIKLVNSLICFVFYEISLIWSFVHLTIVYSF